MAKFAEPVGSLADGAERLERLIKGVKDRQFSEVHNAPMPKTLRNAFAVSPEEAWSKKFMTAGIGPQEFSAHQMPAINIAAPVASTVVFRPVEEPPTAAKPTPAIKAAPPVVRPGHIGAALAKPAPRRTWFGRLIRGS